MLEIELAGQRVGLHASGALLLDGGSLVVADTHLGKTASLRRLDQPVPQDTTLETLNRLTLVLQQTQARQLVFLGDFLHPARARTPVVLAALQAWRARHTGLGIVQVRGHHDPDAGDPPAPLGMTVVHEPLRIGPWALCHHPRPVAGAYVLAGHWHPCVRLYGKVRHSLRLPCFWLGDAETRAVGVLPAFGGFTGMHAIGRLPGDRVFALAGEVVREVPA